GAANGAFYNKTRRFRAPNRCLVYLPAVFIRQKSAFTPWPRDCKAFCLTLSRQEKSLTQLNDERKRIRKSD
ncbi:MAG TPA: hypothetical protein VJS17_09835, partial [Pyrinomonadaceae bacterium]|nr:hypothetical protein [Pyrinomonadaceae bacterium]